ncbi:Brix domain-containing protein [Melampsora americana]|nr:Brix domain-containing protein [Melampsora americana]
MAKRKKNRTHKLKPNLNPSTQPSPKSFIIKSTPAHHTTKTENGIKSDSYNSTSLNLLVKDFRKVMEPNTASNLRERKSNRLKDFLAMAGPLGVTHMIVFSQSLTRSKSIHQDNLKDEEIMSSINLKIYKVPRGPTLSFKVLRYSLMIDILNADKAPRSPGQEFKTEPLLIMNNFNPTPTTTTDETNQLNLLTTTFRNLFPQIKIQEIQLIQTRRIVFLSYNPITKTIDFRHYLITVKPIGVSKNIRKLMEGTIVNTKTDSITSKKRKRVLDLSGVEDLAEYVLGESSISKSRGPSSIASSGGFTSDKSDVEKALDEMDYDLMSSGAEDESENEIHENKIELPQHYLGKGNLKNSKKAIKLKELGPRLELGLVKIEQGLGNGDVLFHEFS